MHSSNGGGIALEHARSGIWVDSEVAGGFIGVICALDRAEGSFDANVAVFVLDVAVVSNPADDEYQRTDSQNSEHNDDGYDDQDDLERAAASPGGRSLERGDGRRDSGGQGYRSTALRTEFAPGCRVAPQELQKAIDYLARGSQGLKPNVFPGLRARPAAPEGASGYATVTASLKRCPDTNRAFVEQPRKTCLPNDRFKRD